MKAFLIFVLSFSLSALGKPKASDFKEILVDEDSKTEETSKASAEEPKVVLKPNEEILSGSVRVMRKIDRTEVFFKDLKDSYAIPSGANYGSIYRAFEESQKKGTSVSFKANTKSRQVLSLESAPASSSKSAPGIDSGGKKSPGSQ